MKKGRAKSIVMQTMFRSRQEKSKKGIGSYDRKEKFKNKARDSGLYSFCGLLVN